MRRERIARREYFSIGEVCELTGLKPHVLRYWETQFRELSPSKNRAGNRVYRAREIKIVELVKHLLYDEKYTIDGARGRLEKLRERGELDDAAGQALDRQAIKRLDNGMEDLVETLTVPTDDTGIQEWPNPDEEDPLF